MKYNFFMKKFFLCFLMCVFSFFLQNAYAEDFTDGRIVVEALNDVVILDTENISLKVLEGVTFGEDVTFETDSVIDAKIKKIVAPRKGKRDGYLLIKPISYTIPSENRTISLEDSDWVTKVVDYKPFSVANAAFKTGITAASFFVKGLSSVYYFGKGVMDSEDGENRLKSGAKSVYENSPLAYVEKGESVNISKGDILLLKFYNEDCPKWKVWAR